MKRAILLATLWSMGCAVHAQPLASLPLSVPCRIDPSQRSNKRILILPFEDLRGDEYSRSGVSNHIPVLSLIYSRGQLNYPEHAGVLRTEEHNRRTVAVGGLETAMPQLLGATMQKMALSSAIASAPGFDFADQQYDYVVAGRIHTTRFDEHSSAALAIAGGLVGVPYVFITYNLAYDITLYDARDRRHALFQRTYGFRDSRAAGLYYNQGWSYPMFVRGLEQTLPEVVFDLAAVMAQLG